MSRVIREKDAVRMAAMAYRMLRKRNVYFLYIKMFYDTNVTASNIGMTPLLEMSLLDRKRHNGNIIEMMCVMVKNFISNKVVVRTNPMLYPIYHNVHKFTNIDLTYAIHDYITWLAQVNAYIRQGVTWKKMPRYLLNIA